MQRVIGLIDYFLQVVLVRTDSLGGGVDYLQRGSEILKQVNAYRLRDGLALVGLMAAVLHHGRVNAGYFRLRRQYERQPEGAVLAVAGRGEAYARILQQLCAAAFVRRQKVPQQALVEAVDSRFSCKGIDYRVILRAAEAEAHTAAERKVAARILEGVIHLLKGGLAQQIVAVEEENISALGKLDALVAGGGNAAVLLVYRRNALILRGEAVDHGGSAVGRAVVHYYNLYIFKALSEQAIERLGQEALAIVCGHDYRHFRSSFYFIHLSTVLPK